MDSLIEDFASLNELFRERCTSADADRIIALQRWEAAYGGDRDSQPDLDVMSIVGSECFLDEPDVTAINDDDSDDGLDGGTRHTAFSMDSEYVSGGCTTFVSARPLVIFLTKTSCSLCLCPSALWGCFWRDARSRL
jgi:hypothetical protein